MKQTVCFAKCERYDPRAVEQGVERILAQYGGAEAFLKKGRRVVIKPNLLLPATTALGTIDPQGREKGILAGANVVMPNLSPVSVRKKYELYDNKICTGEESAQCRTCLNQRMLSIGYEIVTDRGDIKSI